MSLLKIRLEETNDTRQTLSYNRNLKEESQKLNFFFDRSLCGINDGASRYRTQNACFRFRRIYQLSIPMRSNKIALINNK